MSFSQYKHPFNIFVVFLEWSTNVRDLSYEGDDIFSNFLFFQPRKVSQVPVFIGT